jgi:hypothetical protein
MFDFVFDKQKQHLCVCGSTGSGKSVYVEKILNQQIEKGYVLKEDIHVFIPSSNNENFSQYNKYSDFKNVFPRLWDTYSKSEKSCIIIFDDFNDDKSVVNMRHEDDLILKLFNQGRKFLITAIVIGHNPSLSLGTNIKQSVYYFAYFPNNNKSTYKYIADNFLSGDVENLKEKCREVQQLGEHGVVIIDRRSNVVIDENQLESNNENGTRSSAQGASNLALENIDFSNMGIPNTAISSGGQMTGMRKDNNYGVNSNIVNNGQYYDNSQINIQNKNIEYNNLLMQEKNMHNIRITQLNHKREEDKESYKYEIRTLMSKVPHSLEDKNRLVFLLRNVAKKNASDINITNYHKYGKAYIKKHFNEEIGYDIKKNNLLQIANVYTTGNKSDLLNYGIQNAVGYVNENTITNAVDYGKKALDWFLVRK